MGQDVGWKEFEKGCLPFLFRSEDRTTTDIGDLWREKAAQHKDSEPSISFLFPLLYPFERKKKSTIPSVAVVFFCSVNETDKARSEGNFSDCYFGLSIYNRSDPSKTSPRPRWSPNEQSSPAWLWHWLWWLETTTTVLLLLFLMLKRFSPNWQRTTISLGTEQTR